MTKVLLRSVLALFPLLRWSSAALNEPLSGACINQYGPPKFPVRVVAAKLIFMVFDNEGHSAFNSFDGMEQYGNCIDVHLTYDLREFNVTVACHGVSGRTVATTGGPWESMSMALSNYSNGLFILNACTNVDGNATRRGSFMVQTKEQFDKLFRKEEGFDRVYFEYDQSCQCSFRNEFVMSFDGEETEDDKWIDEFFNFVIIVVGVVFALLLIACCSCPKLAGDVYVESKPID